MALPGEVKKITNSEGSVCEEAGCSHHATHKYCSESDSFGDEWTYLCETHLPDPNAKNVSDCDQCHAEKVVVVPTRDPEEIHGPVSYLCPDCLEEHRKHAQSLMDDLSFLDDDEDDWDDWDEDFDND